VWLVLHSATFVFEMDPLLSGGGPEDHVAINVSRKSDITALNV
jgi:hypothetical protein